MNREISRSRDSAATRSRILSAAQTVFSERAYPTATVRDITALADVNASLVSRYFGSKEKLYEAALTEALDASALLAPDRSQFGKSIMAYFLDPGPGEINPVPMMVLGVSDPVSQEIVLRLLNERILDVLSSWFEGADGVARAGCFMALATGFFTYRTVLPLEPFEDTLDPAILHWFENAFQSLVDAG